MARLHSAKTNAGGSSLQGTHGEVRGEGAIVGGARASYVLCSVATQKQVRLCHRLAHTEHQYRGANATSLLS
jgi:hypothetical protein